MNAGKIIESELTDEQIERIHEFGECWIDGYDRNLRDYFKKALWLWAWDKQVVYKEQETMNAQEARELTEKNLSGPVIKPLLDAIYAKIKQAAVVGRKSITHPWRGLRMTYPTPEQQNAVWRHLSVVDGYNVKHHQQRNIR